MVYLFRTQLLALKAWCLPPEYHRRILDKWRGICQASWTVEINKRWIWLETFCQQTKMVQLWVKELIEIQVMTSFSTTNVSQTWKQIRFKSSKDRTLDETNRKLLLFPWSSENLQLCKSSSLLFCLHWH